MVATSDEQIFLKIDSVRIDDFFRNYGKKINFIKIDIEGGEAEAIKGMTSLLQKTKNIKMMVEFFPFLLNKFSCNSDEFVKNLKALDFQVYDLDRKQRRIDFVEVNKLLKKYNLEKENHTNLLCVKGSQIMDTKDLL